jgi:hypothetical protein
MKLQLTPKEYRRILQMLYIADHVLNGRRDDEPVGLRLKCEEALQGFLGYAESFGCADLVEQPEEALFNFTRAMPEEPGVSETINDYDEDTFWQELVTRLAERDYERIHGKPAVPDPDGAPETDEQHEERENELKRLEEGYWPEFEAVGVKNVEVIKGGFGRPS